MLSKLHIFCRGIMEAAWLAAVVVIPLFFNVSSTQTFEPDKASVLLFLAVLAGGAFLLKRLTAKPPRDPVVSANAPSESLLRHPLVLLVLILAAIYALSSIFSIVPAVSWLGSYKRAQGTFVFYGYIMLFLVVCSELRRPAQLRRLQYAFILASLPIAAYGILQYLGADFLPWTNPMHDRSSSTMGNPIFLGAYLAMAIPLTFDRLVAAIGMARGDSGRKPGLVLAGSCMFALLLQVFGLLFTQSRGPVIGLAVSVYVCLLLLLILKRTPGNGRFIFPAVAAGIGVLVPLLFVAMLYAASALGVKIGFAGLGIAAACLAVGYRILWRSALGRSWLWLSWLVQTVVIVGVLAAAPSNWIAGTLAGSPLDRLTRLSGNSVDVRRSLWETALHAAASGSPSPMPEYAGDRYRKLRPIIGYGPENSWFIANHYATQDLVRLHARESVDRFHNEIFDYLITVGFTGAAVWLMIVAAALYYALRLLGFSCGQKGINAYVPFAALGAMAGILLPWAAGRSYLAGVGAVAGVLAGAVAFAVWSAFRNKPSDSRGDDRQIFVLCILGAVIAHICETAFGIGVSSTRTGFFILIALLAVLSSRGLEPAEVPAKQRASKLAIPSGDPVRLLALISGFAVLVLGWAFILNGSNETGALQLFLQAWFSGYAGMQAAFVVPGSLLLLIVIVAGSAGLQYGAIPIGKGQGPAFRNTVLPALGLVLLVWLAAAYLSAVSWTASDRNSASGLSLEAELRIAFFFAGLFIMVAALAWRLAALEPVRGETGESFGLRPAGFTALVVVCALAVVHLLVLRPVRADAVCRIAGIFERSGNLPAAQQLYARAAVLAPQSVPYWISKGMAQASVGDSGGLRAGIESLQHAVDLNPLDLQSTRSLAGILMKAAERSPDPGERGAQIRKALELYQRTAFLAPNYPDGYCDQGRAYLLLGDDQRAAGLYEKALRINPHYARTHMFLGEMYYRRNDLELAYREFQTVTQLERRNVDAWKNLGFILARLGRRDEAIRANLAVLERAPRDTEVLCRLSVLHFEAGNPDAGHAYARRAYELSDPAARGTYEGYVAVLQNH